jgi:hypothetical protein
LLEGIEGKTRKRERRKTCLLPLPSFIVWSAYWSLTPRSAAKNGGGYYRPDRHGISCEERKGKRNENRNREERVKGTTN